MVLNYLLPANDNLASGIDHRAVLRRFDLMIETLRERHICDGWKVDERAAARVRKYFHACTHGEGDEEQEWPVAVDFLVSHGISLDWIVDGDPKWLLCRCASHSQRAIDRMESQS